MKKLFFYVAVALTLTACNSDDLTTSNPVLEKAEAFGTHSTEIDVNIGKMSGFGHTRGCDVSGNMWDYMPEYPTSQEISDVMDYIYNHSDEGIDVTTWNWKFYYIQQIGGGKHQYSYVDKNGVTQKIDNGTAKFEHMEIQEYDNNWQHVYNFNRGDCQNAATHNSSLMTNGFKAARALNEYSGSMMYDWRLFKFNGNYYLGFDFSLVKDDGTIPADGIYDDWVVKIIPGKGEVAPTPVPEPKPDPTPDPKPDPTPVAKVPEVEVDIHHQAHKDWNEIKTSIHLRDTVNVRIFIPADKALQAVPDDFDVRTGDDYNYITKDVSEVVKVKYTIASKEFEVDVQVNHKANGIEILLAGADCAEALEYARGIYDDGLTFEIHSYLYPDVSAATIWNDILKKVEIPETSLTRWPGNGSCVTHTHGQVHSAYYEGELIPFVKDPK